MPYGGDPAGSPEDEIRFLIGDVDPVNGLLSDDEIDYVIAKVSPVYSDPLMIASYAAQFLGARYAAEVSISADGVSIAAEQLAQKYRDLAADLRQQYKTLNGVAALPIVGGIDPFIFNDPSIRPLNFGIGMHDNQRAGSQDSAPRETVDDYPTWLESSPW